MTRPIFIILLGPTGVGKTNIVKAAYPNYQTAAKIEKDKYITDSWTYNSKIHSLVSEIGKEEIKRIIESGNDDKKKKLTEKFNNIYFETNREECYDTKLSCSDYHDKKLTDEISKKNNVILEINGDKSFKWLFDSTTATEDDTIYGNDIRRILKNDYDIKLLYLSSNYNSLLESNKTRFLEGLKKCNYHSCGIRLANFLLENTYKEIIKNIFKIHEEFPKDEYRNIERVYWNRTRDKYTQLNSFDDYKSSFDLPPNLETIKEEVKEEYSSGRKRNTRKKNRTTKKNKRQRKRRRIKTKTNKKNT